MTKKWNVLSNIGLACTAILSIVTGIIEQRQMEEQIRETVDEVLAERQNEEANKLSSLLKGETNEENPYESDR